MKTYDFPTYVYVLARIKTSEPTDFRVDPVVIDVAASLPIAKRLAMSLFNDDEPVEWSHEYYYGFECWRAIPEHPERTTTYILLRKVRDE